MSSVETHQGGSQCPLAHNLNNMLCIVLGSLELAAGTIVADSDVGRYIASARASAKRMATDLEQHQQSEVLP
jgi:hypothetical protein